MATLFVLFNSHNLVIIRLSPIVFWWSSSSKPFFWLLLLFSFFFIFDKYHYQNDQREIKEGFLPYTNLIWILQWWYCTILLAYEDKNTRIRFCRDDSVLLCWFIEKETHVFGVMLFHGDRNTWIRLYSDNVDLLCWFIQEKNLEIDSKVMILYCYAGLYW